MTSGLLDSLADSAHQGTSNNLTSGPDHLEEGKDPSELYSTCRFTALSELHFWHNFHIV